LAGLKTLCFQQANNLCFTDQPPGTSGGPSLLFYRWTDGPSRLEGPSLLLCRWTDGPSRLEGPLLLLYRWTDGPSRLEGPSLLLCRWTDGYEHGSTDGYEHGLTDGPLTMLRGCYLSTVRPVVFRFVYEPFNVVTWFVCLTVRPMVFLNIVFGRLTDGTYSTQAPPASSDGNEARRFFRDCGADWPPAFLNGYIASLIVSDSYDLQRREVWTVYLNVIVGFWYCHVSHGPPYK